MRITLYNLELTTVFPLDVCTEITENVVFPDGKCKHTINFCTNCNAHQSFFWQERNVAFGGMSV